ncbi:hypothetical protein MMPV_001125 [Pyropia vietnamensis]
MAAINHPVTAAYRNTVVDDAVLGFVTASAGLGAEVVAQASAVSDAFAAQAAFLATAGGCAKPTSDEDLSVLLGPTIAAMTVVSEAASAVAPSHPRAHYLSAVGDSIGVLGWVAVDSKPVAHIADTASAGDFFLNKVLMSSKGGTDGPAAQTWVAAFRGVVTALKAYVKEHHTQGLVWEFASKVSTTSPMTASRGDGGGEGRSAGGGAGGGGGGAGFTGATGEALAAYLAASKVLGGPIAKQAEAFAAGFKAEEELLEKVGVTPKPADPAAALQPMLEPISAAIGAAAELGSSTSPQDPLFNHLTGVGESVGVLGWVAVDSKPVAYISDMEDAGSFFLNKVLMGAKTAENKAAQQAWVRSVRALYAALKAYVKEHHTQGLVWEFASKVSTTSPMTASRGDGGGEGRSAGGGAGGGGGGAGFTGATGEALAAYLAASKVLGGPIAKQAEAFAAGFKAEEELLEKVGVTPKPADPAAALQPMLEPISAAIGAAAELGSSTSPQDPLFNHLTGVGESVGVLGWVAVDSKPVAYISDMEDAGSFFLNKVLMGAKTAENKAAQQAWVRSVRALYAALKAYVKEHHTQGLVWEFASKVSTTSPMTASRGDGGGEGRSAGGGAGGGGGGAGFTGATGEALAAYLAASKVLGGPIAKQAEAFAAGFKAEEELLEKVGVTPKPADPAAALQPMLEPISAAIGAAAELGSSTSPQDPLFNHLTGVGESVGVLGWVAVDSKPVAYITENKAAQQAWVRSVRALYAALKAYVKEYHTTCLMWNTAQ